MALITLPAGEVTLIAATGNDFRAENLSPYTIRLAYGANAPADLGDDWGSLPPGNIEIRTVGGNLYGYSSNTAKVSVFETAQA